MFISKLPISEKSKTLFSRFLLNVQVMNAGPGQVIL
jgi:hypothetical protein